MARYNFIKWIVVNLSDEDPFKYTDPNKTFWKENDAQLEAGMLGVKHKTCEFLATQVIVPYEPSPVAGLGDNGPLGTFAPHDPVDPRKLEMALTALQDMFPSMHFGSTANPSVSPVPATVNYQDKEEKHPNG